MGKLKGEQKKEFDELRKKALKGEISEDKDKEKLYNLTIKALGEDSLTAKHLARVKKGGANAEGFYQALSSDIAEAKEQWSKKVGVAKQFGIAAPFIVLALKAAGAKDELNTLKDLHSQFRLDSGDSLKYPGDKHNAGIFFNQGLNHQQNNNNNLSMPGNNQ